MFIYTIQILHLFIIIIRLNVFQLIPPTLSFSLILCILLVSLPLCKIYVNQELFYKYLFSSFPFCFLFFPFSSSSLSICACLFFFCPSPLTFLSPLQAANTVELEGSIKNLEIYNTTLVIVSYLDATNSYMLPFSPWCDLKEYLFKNYLIFITYSAVFSRPPLILICK